MNSSDEFKGKKVLVTGGAKGVGKAIVEKFYEEGAEVIAFDKDGEALEILQKELPNLTIRQIDLTDWEKTKQIIHDLSPIHHLVNNAGIFLPALLMDITMENFDLTFGLNIKATVNVTQAFVKGNGEIGGTIVNISSYADSKTLRGAVSYSCSKAALTMLTKCMAMELGPAFRVNCIRPCSMETDMMHTIMKNHPDLISAVERVRHRAIIPEKLLVTDCAELVFFLSSSKSCKITGEAIAVDRGMGVN